MKKKILSILTLTTALYAGTATVSAQQENGWTISNEGSGTAEISTEYAYEGISSLHVSGVGEDGDVTVSHPMSEIMNIQRIYRVTFFAKGEYNPDNIVVGWGNRTTGTNHVIINLLPVSHEKVEVSDAGDGWKKYSYTVKQNSGANKIENNTNMTLTFKNASGEVYIDDISIVFEDSYDRTRDTDGYKVTGHGILTDGSFEEKIASDSGDDIADYGWSVNAPNTSGLTAAADTSIWAAARVLYNENSERAMYVKYNALGNTDSAKALILSKDVAIADATVYVTLDVKGAYLPSSVLVGGENDNSYQALVGGASSSFDNPYGGNVTAQKLANGYTRYKVKTAAKGDKLRIKILGDCLGMYIDNISVTTLEGNPIAIDNGDFDTVYYDAEAPFAEGFEGLSAGERAFVQRVSFNKSWTAYIKTNESRVGLSQGLTADDGAYTISFDVLTVGSTNNILVGFGENIEDFSGALLSAMSKEDIGGGWYRYSATLAKKGSKLIIASSGECTGAYIDNISVKSADGTELITNGDLELKTQPPAYQIGKVKLYKNNAEVENISSGSHKAVVSVENNFCPDMDFTLILCHVRDGQLIRYQKNKVTLTQNGDEDIPADLECTINLSDCTTGDTLEAYVWDNTDSMKSLSSYCVFNTL